ncbi:MAG: DUF5681 domain-containing protein [Phycisphaerales bacterium]
MSDHARPRYKPGGVTGKGWKPGQSGNPGGRPRGESITATLRRLVAETEHNGRPIQDLLAEVLLKEALKGKYPFAREILERLDGRVSERHEVRVEGGDWRAKMGTLTDDDLIEMAEFCGRTGELSPRLSELREKRLAEGGGAAHG